MQTAYNLVVACYALGDKERMKQSFSDLVGLPGWSAPEGAEEGEEEREEEDGMHEIGRVDGLREELRRRQSHMRKSVPGVA